MSSRRDSLKDIPFEKSVHAGLWLDKYIKDQVADKVKSDLVKDVSTTSLPVLYDTFYKRWEKTLTEFGASPREATVLGRMIIGLGDESVLETSVTLHHTYGVPYIPGSALKGLAASYVHQKLGEEWMKESKAYKTIFGETDEAGYITFFDAYYIPGSGYQGKALYPDVITVHHQKYYQENGKAAPADWDSPIPVPFLSATGKYLIALAAPELQQPTEWINTTFTILGEALKTLGIGAKTSSGYGRMVMKSLPGDPAIRPGTDTKEKTVEVEPYQRPNIPLPKVGQRLMGIVLDPNKDKETIKRIELGQASAYLKWKDRELPTKILLMMVPAEYADAKIWQPGQTKNCVFLREEVQGNCTVWICRPQ